MITRLEPIVAFPAPDVCTGWSRADIANADHPIHDFDDPRFNDLGFPPLWIFDAAGRRRGRGRHRVGICSRRIRGRDRPILLKACITRRERDDKVRVSTVYDAFSLV